MKFCSKCGKEILEEAVVCPNCGCAVSNTTTPTTSFAPQDEVSVGLVILSVIIPLFGIIYWPVKHKETPKKAKACGIAGIISWVVSFIFSMIFSAATFGSLFSILEYM